MPNYRYRCQKPECQSEFDEFRPVDERHQVVCPACGSAVEILILSVGLSIFKPDWYEHIALNPIWIESKAQLREECRKHKKEACALM